MNVRITTIVDSKELTLSRMSSDWELGTQVAQIVLANDDPGRQHMVKGLSQVHKGARLLAIQHLLNNTDCLEYLPSREYTEVCNMVNRLQELGLMQARNAELI